MNRLSGTQLTIIATLFAGVVLLASIAGGDVTNLETIELAQTPTATTYMMLLLRVCRLNPITRRGSFEKRGNRR